MQGGQDYGFLYQWVLPRVTLREVVTSFTFVLILAEIAYFSATVAMNGGLVSPTQNSTIGPSRCALIAAGAKFAIFVLHKQEYWRILSSVFLHSGLISLSISAALQYLVVLPFELEHGRAMCIAAFLLCACVGNMYSCVASPREVDTGPLGGIIGIAGMSIMNLIISWPGFPDSTRRNVGLVEGLAIVFAIIVGQSVFVDSYATFVGLVMGVFLGGMAFSRDADLGRSGRLLVVCLGGANALFLVFISVFLFAIGEYPMLQDVAWTSVCRTDPPECANRSSTWFRSALC